MYKTKDLCLATTLESVGLAVNKITTKGKQATFWFDESPDLDIAIDNYWNRKLKIEPREFFTNLKGLKGRIYESI